MKKDYDIDRYKESVRINDKFFRKYYFHSIIDLNLIKLGTILENGILSKRLISKKSLPNIFTHQADDYDSKNGNSFISLSEYKDERLSKLFDSFALHTLSSLSLLVSKDIEISTIGERETYFTDEIFCKDYIDKSNLLGIMLPEHLSNLSINEVSCLPSDLTCYTKSYLNNWLKAVERYFKREIPKTMIEELNISHEQLWDILDEYESPERWTASALETQKRIYDKDLKDILGEILQYEWEQKYKTQDLKYLDIITRLNKNNLPIYEIQEKSLRKVL